MNLDEMIVQLLKLQQKGMGKSIINGCDDYTGQESGTVEIRVDERVNNITIVMPRH